MGLLGTALDALTGRLRFQQVQGEDPSEEVWRAARGECEYFVRKEPHRPEWLAQVQDARTRDPVDVADGFPDKESAVAWCEGWT